MNLIVDMVSFAFDKLRILDGISFTAESGVLVGLVGANGTGKSTLLRCLLGLLSPSDGSIRLDETDIANLSSSKRALLFSYVPQALSSAFPVTVFDFVMLGRKPHIYWKPSPVDEERVAKAISRVGLSALAFRDVTTLSGGERQRAMVARAFTQEAKVMLLDEPTANLDIKHQIGVLRDVRREVRVRGIIGIVAIHDLNLASRFCDRLLLMKGGKVFADGHPGQVVTEENVASAYDADIHVTHCGGLPVIVPMAPSELRRHRRVIAAAGG